MDLTAYLHLLCLYDTVFRANENSLVLSEVVCDPAKQSYSKGTSPRRKRTSFKPQIHVFCSKITYRDPLKFLVYVGDWPNS